MNTPIAEAYRQALQQLLDQAAALGFSAVELTPSAVHKHLSGSAVRDERMPVCYLVMRQHMSRRDEVVKEPNVGTNEPFVVRYRLQAAR